MRKSVRPMEMRRKMGCAHYYAWRIGCKLHMWQKQFEYGTAMGVLSETLETAMWALVWGLADCLSWIRQKGLKTALYGLVWVFAVIGLMTACARQDGQTYARLLQVVDVSEMEDAWSVKLQDCNGMTWRIDSDCGDYAVGEMYSCIMSDMGTRQIADDQILSMRYERPDMMPIYPISFE